MPYETITHNGRQHHRYYPEGAIKLRHKGDLGIVYVSTNLKGRTVVLAYRGNASKPAFHYSYGTPTKAEAEVTRFFASLTAHKQAVATRRKSQNAPHTLIVGDIITNSWGYDQTNVDWYRVARTSEHYVWLQPIAAAHAAEAAPGPMSGYAVAAVDVSAPDPSQWTLTDLNQPATKHRASGSSVTMKYGCGSKWDGRPMYESWYA